MTHATHHRTSTQTPTCVVWIDHARARIGRCDGTGAFHVVRLESGVEGKRRASGLGGMSLPMHTGGDPGLHPQRHMEEGLRRFYDDVCTHLRHEPRIMIVGPGEAPRELADRVAHTPYLNASEVLVEKCDKATDAELREFLRREWPAAAVC